MVHTNLPLDPERLPRLEAIPLTPVSPRLAPCQALQQLWRWWLLALLASLVPLSEPPLADWQGTLAIGIAGLGLVLAVFAWVEARRRAYGLREHDLCYRRGLWVRRTQVLPLVRLQHVETLSTPLERAFGLVRLACFTAGGGGADLVLEGLPADRAEAVKRYLLARLESESGTPEPVPPEEPLP
ncbi:PH domain-containing protein [Halomonas sp. C05BenzN]|uniref:PH domain-containing protein n=1 Tax=Halomonas sp. C05BenzN TaxID=3411041 RepID=UPI003B943595